MISCWARLVTMVETWLYHYDPETKQQSMEWRQSNSPRLKKFRVQKSAGRILASIFWDQDSILSINYTGQQRIKFQFLMYFWTLNLNIFPEFLYRPQLSIKVIGLKSFAQVH